MILVVLEIIVKLVGEWVFVEYWEMDFWYGYDYGRNVSKMLDCVWWIFGWFVGCRGCKFGIMGDNNV